MIASHATHSTAYASKEVSLFLKRPSSAARNVKDTSKRHASTKIVPLEEIVYIEGTVSVAF